MAVTTYRQPTTRDTIRHLVRLLRLESRRSLGLLFFPIFLVASWYASNRLSYVGDSPRVALWPEDSLRASFALILLAPVVAALAAWEAGREQRRKIGDLLATTPRPPISRDLSRWVAVTSWGLLAYAVMSLVILIPTARQATWGGPLFGALAMGAVGIVAAGAIGTLAGTLVPSRFVAPLMAIALFVVESGIAALGPDDPFAELKYLSPFAFYLTGGPETAVFYELQPDLFEEATIWLAGVAGCAVSLVALRRRIGPGAVLAMLASLIVAASGAQPLLAAKPDWHWGPPAAIPYQPVCADGTITVCVHPAYEVLLPEIAAGINLVADPLIGLPDVPTRVDVGGGERAVDAQGTFRFSAYLAHPVPDAQVARTLVSLLVANDWNEHGNCPTEFGHNASQAAITEALLLRGGWSPAAVTNDPSNGPMTCEMFVATPLEGSRGGFRHDFLSSETVIALQAEIMVSASRFTALTLDEQRAWFAVHYADLRAGHLTLADLP